MNPSVQSFRLRAWVGGKQYDAYQEGRPGQAGTLGSVQKRAGDGQAVIAGVSSCLICWAPPGDKCGV